MRLIPIWVLILLAGSAWGQEPKAVWTATVEPPVVRPGEVLNLVMTGRVAAGWHIYAAAQPDVGPVPTSFRLTTPGFEALGGLREPPPAEHYDEGFQTAVLTHEGEVVLRQPVRVPLGARPGPVELAGSLRFQACTQTSCLRAEDVPIEATVRIEAGPIRPEHRDPPAETAIAPTRPPQAEPEALQGSAADAARARGLFAFLVVAFLAGFAALLTPCVFPMVPITVSFFTKQAGDNARRRIGLAGAYGGGIVVMYTGLGLLLAATLGATSANRIAANPVVNLLFAALFVFFALTLFGVYELQLPSGLVNAFNRRGDAGGYIGAVFMGLTLTLAAFTCTVQFVGGVLVWAANGEWLWPILGMLAFSSAFALPFFLLALFPQYLSSLPRSGGWLENTKVVLGLVEMGAAFKFLSNADLVLGTRLLSRESVLALWAVCALLAALYLWGLVKIGHGPLPERLGAGRRRAGWLFLALTLWLLWGLSGARIGGLIEALLPPPEWTRDPARQAAGEVHWITDYDDALATAKATGRNVFLDFTGVTCTNCRWMEQNVFTRPEIRERLAKLVTTRLYTDTGPDAARYQQMQTERYHTASLPFYAIVRPDGETIATFDGLTRDAAEFAAFLDRGTAP